MSTDQVSCLDIDECKETPNICGHYDATCFNIRGNYKCPVVQCPSAYTKSAYGSPGNRVKSGGIVCHRKPCKLEDKMCIEDKTLTIGWEFISIPSHPDDLQEPLTLVMVHTKGYTFYPKLILTLEEGNEKRFFDTVIHESTGNFAQIVSSLSFGICN